MATSLQKTGDARQAYIIDKIKELDIRFPVAELSKKGIATKGNISEILNGKRAVSDEVFKNFCKVYNLDGDYSPLNANVDDLFLYASTKALSFTVARLMSKVSELSGNHRDVEECLQEIQQNTSLILNDLRKSRKE